jgi:methylated-DNA-[protein]-cysteine S-methyltransferase
VKELLVDRVETQIGDALLVVDGAELCALEFADSEGRLLPPLTRRFGPVRLAAATDPHGFSGRLRAYFAGELTALDAIPVSAGGTPFQRLVWRELRAIAPGSVATYGQLAARIGHPAAYRAVGAANGSNPVSVVVPCHRLVGASGSLIKYGGGLERKRWLLRHEGLQILDCVDCR